MKNLRAWIVLTFMFLFFSSGSSWAQVVATFTSDKTASCAPADIRFQNTSSGNPTTFHWDFGDGNISVLDTPRHTYSLPGVYSVKLVVSNGSSTDSITKLNYITVFRNPIASYSITDDSICSGRSITFTSNSIPGDAGIQSYSWTFNDGSPTVTGVATLSHTFTNLGNSVQTLSPVLLINDSNGCNSTVSDTVFVFPQPLAVFGISQINACTAPSTVSFSNSSQNAPVYTWNFGDPSSGANNTSPLTTPSHIYNDTGTYVVTLTAGVSGCTSTATRSLTIAQPNAAFSMDDSTICLNGTVQFTNTGSTGLYSWNFGDPASGGNNTSALANPTHTFLAAGIHQVRLIVGVSGCPDTLIRTVTVYTPPVISIYTNRRLACDTPYTVQFHDTTTGIVSANWNYGDPASGGLNTGTGLNSTHNYHSFGSFNVQVTVTDVNGCSSSATFPNYVQIIQPTITMSDPDSGCVGSTFQLSAAVTSPADPSITSYAWNFGDGTPVVTGPASTISHTFNTVGIFTVSVTITTSTGCSETLAVPAQIKIGTRPHAQFTAAPDTICFKSTLQFNDGTPQPVTGWQWFFSDGGGSTAQNPSHQYNLDTSGYANPYDVILIAYYNGCADTDTVHQVITVLGPITLFDTTYDCSNPLHLQFTNLTGHATTYSWNFGDGSPLSALTSPSHNYTASGDFPVTLTAFDAATGCTIDSTILVRPRNLQAIIAANPINGCAPATISFTGSGSQDNIAQQWYFGEGIPGVSDTSLAINTTHLYTRPGVYDVRLILTDIHNCHDTAHQTITIKGPTAGFTASPASGCAPLTTHLTDTSHTAGGNIVQWIWNYGTSIDTTVTGSDNHPYPLPGYYNIILTVTDVNGCSDADTAFNYIHVTKPVAGIFFPAPDTVCANTSIPILGSAGGSAANPVTYQWNFGDGDSTTTTVNPIQHTYTSNGTKPVRLIVIDGNGCRDTLTKNLFVYTTPAVFSSVLTDTCENQGGIKRAVVLTHFIADSTAYAATYFWNLSVANLTTTTPSITYTYSVPPGNYDVSLIVVNRFGCRDTVTKPGLVVVPGPSGNFSLAPDSGCSPLTVNFHGSGQNAAFYTWDFGDGNVDAQTHDTVVAHTYTSVGSYIPQFYLGFQLPTSGDFCYVNVPSLDTVKVTSLVNANIVEDTILAEQGEHDTLHVLVNAPSGVSYTYDWTPFSAVTADPLVNGSFFATAPGSTQYYYLHVPYSSSGCYGLDSVLFVLKECVDTIPNVFTPNGDHLNDTYHIKGHCHYEDFEIKIYNRWGRIVYESNDPEFAWDGKTSGGTELSDGTYYYILHSRLRQKHGYIELIRK